MLRRQGVPCVPEARVSPSPGASSAMTSPPCLYIDNQCHLAWTAMLRHMAHSVPVVRAKHDGTELN